MKITSYATSESYQNGVEVRRGEFDGMETGEGAARLPFSYPFDVVNASLGLAVPLVLRRAA